VDPLVSRLVLSAGTTSKPHVMPSATNENQEGVLQSFLIKKENGDLEHKQSIRTEGGSPTYAAWLANGNIGVANARVPLLLVSEKDTDLSLLVSTVVPAAASFLPCLVNRGCSTRVFQSEPSTSQPHPIRTRCLNMGKKFLSRTW
jgi:hypothetical protein